MFKSIKLVSLFTASLTGAFLIFMGVMVVRGAWTEPGNTPPNGNIAAPINVGAMVQAKLGGLILNNSSGPAAVGLSVPQGKVGIGKVAAYTPKRTPASGKPVTLRVRQVILRRSSGSRL